MVKKILLFFNGLAVLAILLCYLSGIISPEKVSILAFFSLLYPFILIVNILFVFLWTFLLKKYVLISIIAILIRVDYIPLYIQKSKHSEKENSGDIRIICFNADRFRFEKKQTEQVYIESFLNMVSQYKPTIICFQEFLSDNKKEEFNLIKLLKDEYALPYHFSLKKGEKYILSNTIVSTYPIINKGSIMNESDSLPKQRYIFADLKVGKDTIRVYNVHFSSFHLDEHDKAAYENIINQQEFDKQRNKQLFKKLIRTMKKHGKEVNLLLDHMHNCPYKIITCGDFNDTPASYLYQRLSKKLDDAFCSKGNGAGQTYYGIFPSFRIDYILYDPSSFTVDDFHVMRSKISDHYPIFSSMHLHTEK